VARGDLGTACLGSQAVARGLFASQEFVGGLAGWVRVLDEVAGVEDFDEGLGGRGGGLEALVFGAGLGDAVELAQGVLGVRVVVPGDELGEGEVVACGDLGGWISGVEVVLEEVCERLFGDEVWGCGGRGSGRVVKWSGG
jgi:hypothetical protein